MKLYNKEELKLITDLFDYLEDNVLDNDLKEIYKEIKEMFLENQELLYKLQQKENIIKEVREYVDKWENVGRYKLLEILDKGNDKE